MANKNRMPRGTRARPTPPMPPSIYHAYLYSLGRLRHLPCHPKPNQRITFLGLPPEIRFIIYSYLPSCPLYRPMPEDSGRIWERAKKSKVQDSSSVALLRTCRKVHEELVPVVYKTFHLLCDYHMRGGIPCYFTGMSFMPPSCIEEKSGLRELGRNLAHIQVIILICGSITALIHGSRRNDSSGTLAAFDAYSTRPLDDFQHIYELLTKNCPNLRWMGINALPEQNLYGIDKQDVWNISFQGSPTDAEVSRRIVRLGIRSLLRGLKHFRHVKTIVLTAAKNSLGKSRPRKIAEELAFRYETWESNGEDFFALHNPGWKPHWEKTVRARRVKRRPTARIGPVVLSFDTAFIELLSFDD